MTDAARERHSPCHRDCLGSRPVASNQQPAPVRRVKARPGGDRRARAATTGSACCAGRRASPSRSIAQAFVAELNRRLRADSAWREDTRFVVALGADGAVAGTTWEGPESMKPVVARIVKSVIGEFEAEQPFLFDR